MFWKAEDPFTLFPHHLFLSFIYFPTAWPSLFCLLILASHCFSPWPGIQTLMRWLLWDISLPSSWSASFLNKVILLASTLCLSDSLWGEQSKLGLGHSFSMWRERRILVPWRRGERSRGYFPILLTFEAEQDAVGFFWVQILSVFPHFCL